MITSNILMWLLVLCILAYIFYHLYLLLSKYRQSYQAKLGLLLMSIIGFATLIGSLYVQIRAINAFKTDTSSLFILAFFVVQLIPPWTFPQRRLYSPTFLKIYTGIIAIAGIFILAAFIFQW